MKYKSANGPENATFSWDRNKVYDKFGCLVLFEKVQEDPKAKVTKVDKQKKIKHRPFPLNTVEAQKLIS